MNKNYSFVLLILIYLLSSPFCLGQKIFNRNYVVRASSPKKKYRIIGIPERDANRTGGNIYVLDKKNNVREVFSTERYHQSAFVISDNGFLFQFETDLENRIIDPNFRWKIFIHHPYDTAHPDATGVDTLFNQKTDKEIFIIPPIFLVYDKMDKNYFDGFKKKKINTDAISFSGDTLRIKYWNFNSYFSLSTGKYLGHNETDQRKAPFKNIPFRLTLMNAFKRAKLVDKLHENYVSH